MALWCTIGPVGLFQAVLLHEKSQYGLGFHLGDLDVLGLVGFHLDGQVMEHVGKKVRLVVADFIQQHVHQIRDSRVLTW